MSRSPYSGGGGFGQPDGNRRPYRGYSQDSRGGGGGGYNRGGGGGGGGGGRRNQNRRHGPPQPPKPKAIKPRSTNPSVFPPKEPTSLAHRRELVKATAWRLSRILRVPCTELLKLKSFEPLIDRAFPGRTPGRGEAFSLINRLGRLMAWKPGPKPAAAAVPSTPAPPAAPAAPSAPARPEK